MNISPIQNNGVDRRNVEFNGISRLLKNQIYRDGQREIKAVLEQRPKNSLVAGQFPASLAEKIPAELRKVAIPEIIKAFGVVSNAIREFQGAVVSGSSSREVLSDWHRPRFVNDLLTEVFKKYGILEDL